MRQILLENTTAILLQNVSGFLLQNGTALLPNVTVITNSDSATTIKFNIERLPQLDNTML